MDSSPDSIRAVGESDLLELARVARSTWQNWLGQGLVEEQPTRVYGEEAVIEVAAVGLLVTTFDLRSVRHVWAHGRTSMLEQALRLPLEGDSDLHVVVDPFTFDVAVVKGAEELHRAVAAPMAHARGLAVFVMGPPIQEARRGFWSRAGSARDLMKDKRRKPRAVIKPKQQRT